MSESLEQRARKLWDELYPHSEDAFPATFARRLTAEQGEPVALPAWIEKELSGFERISDGTNWTMSAKAIRCLLGMRYASPPQAQDAQDARRPTVVCLCGSTRFKSAFDEANYQETMAGRIVLSVGFFMHALGNKHGESIGATPEQKVVLDELHKRKVELSDEVLILNVGGYIGSSTQSELDHAINLGKRVRYLEPIDAAMQENHHD